MFWLMSAEGNTENPVAPAMKIVDVKIHKLIVPMKPDTVHSPGVDDRLCAPDPVEWAVRQLLGVPQVDH